MKLCSTCLEEFADKFSFCPVDGTPLKGSSVDKAITAQHVSPGQDAEITMSSKPAANYSSSVNSGSNDDFKAGQEAPDSVPLPVENEYHLTIMDDAGLVRRLTTELREVAHESQLTWPEFKRDPFGFTRRLIAGYGRMAGGFFSRPNVAIALITALSSLTVFAVGVAWVERSRSTGVSRFGVGLFAALALGLLVALFIGWFTRGRSASLKSETYSSPEYSSETDMPTVVTAMVAALVFVLFLAGAFYWLDSRSRHRQMIADKQREDLEYQGLVDIPDDQKEPDKGTAGTNKGDGGGAKAKQEKPGGGGGGGREDQRPASQGKLPPASLDIPQVRAPDPNPPR